MSILLCYDGSRSAKHAISIARATRARGRVSRAVDGRAKTLVLAAMVFVVG